jgi:hypothetical protein
MSTYSNLKIQLIGTGELPGTWGTATNVNWGSTGGGIEQAVVGMATISSGFTGSPLTLTLTLTDTAEAQNARALVLNLTQSLGSAGTLNVPAIQKPYMVINATGQTVTVKVSGQTGVAVPTGTRAFLYNNGTDVGVFMNYLPSLTLGTDLAVADGGTGISSGTSGGIPYFSGTTSIASSAALAANAIVVGGGAGVAPSTVSTASGILTWIQTPSSANLAAAMTDETGSGSLVFATSPTLTTPRLAGSSTGYTSFASANSSATNYTITFPAVTDTAAVLGVAQTFTATQTFRAANAIRSEAASTQDAVVVAGRAGGTSSYAVTLTPATLSGNRTVTIPDGGGNYTLGYQNLPPVGAKNSSYELAPADIGKYVEVTSGGSITIPNSGFSAGDIVSIFNNTDSNITITCTITTAYVAGINLDKSSVLLAARGLATVLFTSATACVITGNVE